MARLRLVATAAVIVFLSPAVQARACDCLRSGPPCEEYWKVSAVFLGRVETISNETTRAAGEGRRVRFRVLEAFAGVSAPVVDIHTGSGGGDCGYAFRTGREYLVYARRNEENGTLATGICSRTRAADDAATDLTYARAIKEGRTPAGLIAGDVTVIRRTLAADAPTYAEPLPDITVRLRNNADVHAVTTDRQGGFSVAGLTAGIYSVEVDVGDKYYATILPNPVRLLDARGCGKVQVTAFDDGRVAGRVVDGSRRPVAGLTIDLTIPAGIDRPNGPQRLRTLTGTDGRYELTHVPPGRFIVGINTQRNPDGALPEPRVFHPGLAELGRATRVSVGPGERVTLADFVLPAGLPIVQLSGFVLDADGAPAVDARVFLKGVDPGSYILTEPAITDATGRFVIAAIQGRNYRLFAERPRIGSDTSRVDSSDQVALTAVAGPPVTLTLRRRY